MALFIRYFLVVLSGFALVVTECHQISGINRPNDDNMHPNQSNADLMPGDNGNRQLSDQENGQTTFFEIKPIENDNSPNTPGEIHIDIINPTTTSGYWYSVTIESQNKYTGTAAFILEIAEPTKVLRYLWIPPFSGDFKVIVHELPHAIAADYVTTPFWESRIVIQDKPGFDSFGLIMDRIKRLPSCQTVKRYDVYTTWNGHWFTFRELGMLNHWYFLPGDEMQCKIDYFSNQDLSLNTEKKSIYILGDSKHRGIFLSLVDMLLSSEEKENLHSSVLAKCWGRAIVTKFNLSVMYQDWRTYFEPPGAEPNIICHNNMVFKEGNSLMLQNGLKVFEEMFHDQASWPSVILLVSGMQVKRGIIQTEFDILQLFLSSIPQGWTGTLFLIDDSFCAYDAGRGNAIHFEKYRERLRDLTGRINDGRVRWLDGLGISKEMRLYGEHGPNSVAYSQHFHRRCDELFHDVNNNVVGMKICSNITHMLANLMLDHALGPKDAYVQASEQSKKGIGSWFNLGRATSQEQSESELVYCHACPAGLFPIHITPYPDLICDSGELHPRQENEVNNQRSQSCPEECLKNVPVSNTALTQSGTVEERICPMKYASSKVSDQLHDNMNDVSTKRSVVVDNGYLDRKLPSATYGISILTMVIAIFTLTVLSGRGQLRGRNRNHSALD